MDRPDRAPERINWVLERELLFPLLPFLFSSPSFLTRLCSLFIAAGGNITFIHPFSPPLRGIPFTQ